MADKITLTDLVNLTNQTTAVNAINSNNEVIEVGFDNTLSRDGTQPNQMGANLDMNNNRVLNLPVPASSFEPLRVIDVGTINGGGITVSPLPAGGTIGQVLEKNSSTNFDVSWQSTAGLPTDGTTGQVLTKNSNTNFDASWQNAVTSVGLSLPTDFTVTNSPVTSTGTLTGAWAVTPTGTGPVVRQTSPALNSPSMATIMNGGTLTLPSTSDVIVGRNTTDTLTNKSISCTQLTGSLPAANFPAIAGDITINAASTVAAITANAVTNSQMATVPAYTIKGNSTGSTANPTDISIPALTLKATPVSGDIVMISDSAASNALKYTTAGALTAVGAVASVGGLTGTIALGPGITTGAGNSILEDPAMIGEVRQVAFNRIPTNFLAANGQVISRATFASLFAALVVSSVVTITIATPGVVTWTGNQLQNNDPILLSTTGALPTGLATATKYYVKGLSGNTFNLSATPGGAAINTSGTQSGTHTATNAPWEGTVVGNGTTTFTVPNLNGQHLRGIDNGTGVDTNRSFGTNQLDAFQGHFHQASSVIASNNANVITGAAQASSGSGLNVFPAASTISVTTTVGTSTADGSGHGTPRLASETRPVNQTILYIIRYQ